LAKITPSYHFDPQSRKPIRGQVEQTESGWSIGKPVRELLVWWATVSPGAERQLQPILNWLEQFRYEPIGDREIWIDASVDPELRKGETHQRAVDRIRNEIYRVRNEITAIKAAPLPLAEVKQSIKTQVEEMAKSGVPQLEFVKDYGNARVLWPGDANRHENTNLSEWRALCWMHTQPITDFLTAQAEQMIGAGGIPYAEREPHIAALERRLPSLELEEEASGRRGRRHPSPRRREPAGHPADDLGAAAGAASRCGVNKSAA
jgi:hypothetical protein